MATPPGNLPASPAIPLTADVRAAYQDLYDKMQTAIDSTMDAAVIEALNAMQPQVDRILKQDEEYKLSQDTNIFAALQQQISDTNKGLKTLQGQISSISSHLAVAGDIIAAINKVLTLVPGA
jgi:septal ring factor EnvC (AmiA/AmiB activator)